MPPITWDDVVAVAADLTSVPVAAQNFYLALAEEKVNPAAFGGETSVVYKMARIYYAAHFAAMDLVNGDASSQPYPISSKSEGGVSISYSVGTGGSTTESMMGETTYGRSFLALVRQSGYARAGFVV